MSGPVQGAQECTRGDCRVRAGELAALDAARHQRADGAFVAVAFEDDAYSEVLGKGINLEVRRRSLDLFDDAADVSRCQRVKTRRQGTAIRASLDRGHQKAIERPVLAEEQNFVLAGEIVIEVGR